MTTYQKHAYLILAHNDPSQLNQLITAIDDIRNDIFIHIDKKSDISKFNGVTANKSKLIFVNNRISVFWGDPSQIDAEYALFECVRDKMYSRIHLMSGADYPLKSQDYIHSFFNRYPDDEFINVNTNTNKGEIRKKIGLYNFFLPYIHHPNKIVANTLNFTRRVLLGCQLLFRVNRRTNIDYYKKGSQWVSITQNFANYLLEHKLDIIKLYRYTHCPDEIYKQTLAWNSSFREHISSYGNMRLIDFKRGNGKSPYTYQEKDYTDLISSNAIFARKFSSLLSRNLVNRLNEYLKNH